MKKHTNQPPRPAARKLRIENETRTAGRVQPAAAPAEDNGSPKDEEVNEFLKQYGDCVLIEAIKLYEKFAAMDLDDRRSVLSHVEAALLGDSTWMEKPAMEDLGRIYIKATYSELLAEDQSLLGKGPDC